MVGSPVSNEASGQSHLGAELHRLHLAANEQWHIDSTFMPVPALCNILTAKVVPSSGGNTELASTRAAWAAMPEALREELRGVRFHHNYRRSRERISEALADLPMFNKWPAQTWPAVWRNPVNGIEALYVASHVFALDGVSTASPERYVDDLIEFCTRPEFVYSHEWRVGDVLIWDQRAVLHRGTPWPYDEPRTLMSVCCSLRDEDGLDAARSAVLAR